MSDWTDRFDEPTEPAVTWPVQGQEALFDGNDYHQPHTELPWIPETVMSDDELHSMMIEGRSVGAGASREDAQLAEWGWSS